MLANARLLQKIADFYQGTGRPSTVQTAEHFCLTTEQTRALLKLAGVKLRRGRHKLDKTEACQRQIDRLFVKFGTNTVIDAFWAAPVLFGSQDGQPVKAAAD
jgi:hypothetical protein